MHGKIYPGMLIFIITVSSVFFPFIGSHFLQKEAHSLHSGSKSENKSQKTPKNKRRNPLTPQSSKEEHSQKNPKVYNDRKRHYNTPVETSWDNPPGDWWNDTWGYRKNITFEEPGAVERNEWPVDAYITFTPAAYKYSLRVVNDKEQHIPSQPWNLTFSKDSYLSSATITFLTNIHQGSSKTYQIYWSTNSSFDPPSYPKLFSTTKDSKYVIESRMTNYKVETGAEATGGKVLQVTLPSGTVINQSISHFGITENPSTTYKDYWGENDTNNQYDARGFVKEGNSFFEIYRGTVFVRYQIQNISFTDYANVDFTYTFYPQFWTVKEKIKWIETRTTDTEYYTSGWVFDQDDGNKAMFDHVRDPERFTHMNTSGVEPGLNLTVYNTTGYDNYADNHDKLVELTDPRNSYVSLHGTTFTTDPINWHDNSEVPISPSCPEEHFSTMYQGLIYINETGQWGFATDSDDASELIIDGTIVASYYGAHSNSGGPDHTGNITLEKGYHSFTYRQHERTGEEDAVAYWNYWNTGNNYKVIPGSAYFHSPEPTAISDAEAEDFYNSGSNWKKLAFLHGVEDRGIGISMMNESGITPEQEYFQWYNEGNDSIDDYIFWNRWIKISYAESGDHLSNTYGVIPWKPTGSSLENRLNKFNSIHSAIQNPLNSTIARRERFRLKVSINVQDRNDLGIKDAMVKLIDGSIANYSGTTNKRGKVTFDVRRAWYNITVNVSSGGYTYTNVSIAGAYNETPYTTYEISETVQFPYLVEFLLHAESSGGSNIQNGTLYLRNETGIGNSGSWIITKKTNLTGWIDLLIPATDFWWKSNNSWNCTFNATDDKKWDTFKLESDEGTIVNDSKYTLLNITSNSSYVLVDYDIGEIPPSELLWKNYAAPDPNPVWGTVINGTVLLRAADSEELLSGTFIWEIYDSSEMLQNSTEMDVDDGSYYFELNTSALPAGKTYTLNISGYPDDPSYTKPVPLLSTITVDPVPTSLETRYSPVVEWKDSLKFTVDYCVSGEPVVSDATVKVALTKGEVTVMKCQHLEEISTGRYEVTIDSVNFTTGIGDYSIKFEGSKANYSSITEYRSLTVNARSTDLKPWKLSTSIPWQNNYTFTTKYVDKTGTRINNATVQYNMNEPETGNTVLNGTMTYSSQEKEYKATMLIDGSDLTTELYILQITAEKENYVKGIATVLFELNPRETYLTPNTTNVKVKYTEQVAIKFHFEDLSQDKVPFRKPYIDNATTTYYIPELPKGGTRTGTLSPLGNGSYLFKMDSNLLGVGSCRIYVNIAKSHFAAKNVMIPVEIEEIPTLVTYPDEKSALWGTNITIPVKITELLNETRVDRVESYVTMNGKNYTKYFNETSNQTYIFEVSTLNIEEGVLHFHLNKENYNIQNFDVSLMIKPLAKAIEINYEKISTTIKKNPVSGDTSKEEGMVSVSIMNTLQNRLITDATVKYLVTGIDSGNFTESIPGTYTEYIDWSSAKAGKSYTIKSKLLTLKRDNKLIRLSQYNITISKISSLVTVDYWGGSTSLPATQIRIPNIWFFTMIGGIIAMAGYGSIQVYTYLTTPQEVRKLNQLIEKAKNGNFEYGMITREKMQEEKIKEMRE